MYYPTPLSLIDEILAAPFASKKGGCATISPISIFEREEDVVFEFPVPGLAKEEISLLIEKGVLQIKGEEKGEEKNYRCRASRSVSYQVALDESIDLAKTPKASLQQGILQVVFSKIKPQSGLKIAIE